jgi:hypothetical protein
MSLLLLVLAIALLLLKDAILKSWLESQIRSKAGLDATIGRIELGLFTPTVTLENMIVHNKAEHGGGIMLKMPELRLEYDRKLLSSQKLHLRLLRINIEEVDVVVNEAGISNLDTLQAAVALALKGTRELEFAGIDTLNLTFGKVVYTSLKPPKQVQEQKIGITNEIITGIKTSQDLQQKILLKIMSSKLKKLLG